MPAFLSLSGGVDSTTVLVHLLETHFSKDVKAIHFQYGSKHNKYELDAAANVAKYYSIELIQIDISSLFVKSQSSLMLQGGPIPEGHYAEETMKSTVVPGRNLIFASILASIAEAMTPDGSTSAVYLGAHSGDHAIYPDCRPEFFDRLSDTIEKSSDGKVFCVAPFLQMDKIEIVSFGIRFNAPYHLTRTCYKDQSASCGKCGACVERLEAFEKNNIIDPVEYE